MLPAHVLPSPEIRLRRVRACRADMSDNGIDLTGRTYRELCKVVRRHLGYFQMMLGYEADLREVVALLDAARGPTGDGGPYRSASLSPREPSPSASGGGTVRRPSVKTRSQAEVPRENGAGAVIAPSRRLSRLGARYARPLRRRRNRRS